jgi:hypothetical protein
MRQLKDRRGRGRITNRVYWEKADFWQPQPGNWDYGRARAGGVNCIVDNLGIRPKPEGARR